jgi:NTP pyrophosphatase (non-canonical NTP hydrolase)
MLLIANAINILCEDAYKNSKAKGFHGPYLAVSDLHKNAELSNIRREMLINHLDQACMARIMGEVGEAVEAMRHGNPSSEKIPGFSHVEEELADTLIRIFDYCGMKEYDLGGAVIAKMHYNATRPHLHGKNS